MRYVIVLFVIGIAATGHANPEAPLHLVVRGSSDPASLRAGIAAELGSEVVLVAGECNLPCLDVAIDGSRDAELVFAPSSGASRRRTIMLGNDTTQWPLVVALLAGNLVRDEAADLLASLPSRSLPEPAASADHAPPSVNEASVTAGPSIAGASAQRHDRERAATITVSPLAVVVPMIHMTAELHASTHIGVAAIGAYGRANVCGPDASYIARQLGACDGTSGRSYVFGGQLNYYPMHAFAGVHAGVEVTYGHSGYAGTDSVGGAYTFEAAVLRASPYLGYKLIAKNGFTFVTQVGVAYNNTTSKLETTMMSSPTQQRSLGSQFDLQLGWSF